VDRARRRSPGGLVRTRRDDRSEPPLRRANPARRAHRPEITTLRRRRAWRRGRGRSCRPGLRRRACGRLLYLGRPLRRRGPASAAVRGRPCWSLRHIDVRCGGQAGLGATRQRQGLLLLFSGLARRRLWLGCRLVWRGRLLSRQPRSAVAAEHGSVDVRDATAHRAHHAHGSLLPAPRRRPVHPDDRMLHARRTPVALPVLDCRVVLTCMPPAPWTRSTRRPA